MNLLLFTPDELAADGTLRVGGRRLAHLQSVLQAQVGDRLRVGAIGGDRGHGTLLSVDAREARLQVVLDRPPPAPLDVTVVLALPRPKMLRRVLRSISELGVKELHLINSYRVEKSFWQSPLLEPPRLREYLLAGLEQAADTQLPHVQLHRRFRPFAEDLLPGVARGRAALLAHPAGATPFPSEPPQPALLAVGPEGGFIPFEVDMLCAAGCTAVSLGERTLRVETALPCALGRFLDSAASRAR